MDAYEIFAFCRWLEHATDAEIQKKYLRLQMLMDQLTEKSPRKDAHHLIQLMELEMDARKCLKK